MDKNENEFDPLVDRAPARYVVGIDLGTTNSAVTFVDTEESPWRVQLFSLPQLVAPNQVENRDTLPSFHFQGGEHDVPASAMQLPWHRKEQDWCVGFLARDEGLKSPGRLCASAKSWLCHSGVDREAKLLPWHASTDVERLSPVEVSTRFLAHIRDAWDARFKLAPLAEQDIVITLPASFDEVARELTVRAAAEASLKRIVLIEEPQAAFYAWVHKHDQNWHELVEAGHTILVCDIGGGTSDFTLIKVRKAEDSSNESLADSRVQFHRVAVGEHLILGGDNLDLALAHYMESKLTGGNNTQPSESGDQSVETQVSQQKLTPKQWDVLVRSCRRVKETLLGDDAPEQATVNLPGSGSKLIGGGLQASVNRQEVEQLLVDGFLPMTQLSDAPNRGQSGFKEFGLPFASDPAITKHLAEFLRSHADEDSEGEASRPDVVLFNGGFFASPLLRERLLTVLESWYSELSAEGHSIQVLDNDRLDLAVARGAAYYGMVRRGEGVRIAANLARSYYVEVEGDDNATRAVCLVPGHAQPGQEIHLDELKLELTISQPVEFNLFVSSTRLSDDAGEVVAVDAEQMKLLPPIRTVLRTDRRNQTGSIPVTLHAHLSEIGTIDLWCQSEVGDHRWRLQFDVRSATQTEQIATQTTAEEEGIVDETTWQQCEAVIRNVFDEAGTDKPNRLVKQLAQVLGTGKFDWPTSLLRRIWETLLELREGRKKSAAHEARWLNLLGFSLRPGYGLAVDDWRVAETWRHVHGKLAFAGASQAESLILWRRISGGLSAGQQTAIAEPMIASLRAIHTILVTGKKSRGEPVLAMHESTEAWRLLGSLELLQVPVKVQVGSMIVDLIEKRRFEKVRDAMVWALGRIGQRQPLYGPLNCLVSASEAGRWAVSVSKRPVQDSSHFAVMQMARKTDDRYRDVDQATSAQLVTWLRDTGASERTINLVSEGGSLVEEEQAQVFGDALPRGFRIRQP